jgi:hypothetical protein
MDNNAKAPLKIDDNLLQQLGLGSLPPQEKSGLLKHIYETLEMRVGMRLADQMTNEQLDEFEQYFNAQDDAGAFKWLETNFPNYKDIVADEFEKLKAEVAQSAPQILAAAQQAQMAASAPQQPPQPDYNAPQPQAPDYAGQQPVPQAPYPQPGQPQSPYDPNPGNPQDPYQQPPQYPSQGGAA